MNRIGNLKLLMSFIVFVFLLTGAFSVYAPIAEGVPAKPGVQTHVQSDGSVINYQVIGDEFFNYMIDTNGDLLDFRGDGNIYYANWVSESDFLNNTSQKITKFTVPTSIKPIGRPSYASPLIGANMRSLKTPIPNFLLEYAGKLMEERDAGWREQSSKNISTKMALSTVLSTPVIERNLLIIYVRFTDESNMPELQNKEISNTDISNLVFNEARQGSLAHYYKTTTAERVKYIPAKETQGTTNDGIIKVTLPGAHRGLATGRDWPENRDFREDVIRPALLAAAPFIRVSDYYKNSNGVGYLATNELSIMFIIHGYEGSSVTGPAVWAHAWAFNGLISSFPTVSGVRVRFYCAFGAFQSKGVNPRPFTLGTVAHELGHHSFGFLDFYDIGNNRTRGITGLWSLMGDGSWGYLPGESYGETPTALDAYHLSTLFPPTATVSAANLDFLQQFSLVNSSQFIKLETAFPRQYFLLQPRGNVGYDRGFSPYIGNWPNPYGGLMIYHIDEDRAPWVSDVNTIWKTHPFMDIEEAHGDTQHLQIDTNIGTVNDLFYGVKNRFDNTTDPNSNLYTNRTSTAQTIASFVSVTEITPNVTGQNTQGGSVTVTFKVGAKTVPVTGVTVAPKPVTIAVGKTQALTATVAPANATNKSVTWSSSNTAVATVDTSGIVTGRSAGSATITVRTADGGFTDTCVVTVTVAVTGVTVTPKTVSIAVSRSQFLTATVAPANATNKMVTWSSSNPRVATVSSTGYLTGVSGGSATITVRTADGGFTDTCVITVIVPATGVTVSPKTTTIVVGKTQALVATVIPADATNKSVTWSSSNTAVATVDTSGIVTGRSAGSATITVRTADGGFTDTCVVTVTATEPGISPDNPIIIKTAVELDNIRNGLNKYYKLGNIIDLTPYLASGGAGYAKWGSAGWMPIGSSVFPLTGGLDGAGYKITGLWVDRSNTSYVGLFGCADFATIKNLGVEISAASVRGSIYVGGLVGKINSSSVTNSYSTGNVNGGTSIGGLVGESFGSSVSNCYATGNVSGIERAGGSYYIGGLVGHQSGYNSTNTITNCYTTGNVSATSFAGGLVGYQFANSSVNNITNCYATGDINGDNRLGGLVGLQGVTTNGSNSIANCFATGNVNGTSFSGGLVGYQDNSKSGINSITGSYRYQLARVNGALRTENTPNGIHGGIMTESQLKTQLTYINNKWSFGISQWYWDSRGFPKLNIGVENIPFRFTPDGSLNNPIIITTATQLDDVRNGLNKYYKLGNNIDLIHYLASSGAGYSKWGAAGWMPIGIFTGGFDGNGYKITGLWINRNTVYVGLFGNTNGATIKNLGVEISSSGVKGSGFVGGLAGVQKGGSITNCYSTGNVSGTSSNVGGLVGEQADNASISNCYATGNVSGTRYVGGLVGDQYTVSGSVTITNCYATGNVSGTHSDFGGLVGAQCAYNRGSCTITNSYATGNASGSGYVGGLIGSQVGHNSSIITITNCYATGNVYGSSAGGLVGNQYSNLSSVSITGSYRYQLATVNGALRTENTPNSIHGGIMTATQLKTQSTYTNNKWSFGVSQWIWDSRGFPKLNMGVENVPFRF